MRSGLHEIWVGIANRIFHFSVVTVFESDTIGSQGDPIARSELVCGKVRLHDAFPILSVNRNVEG